MSLPEIRTGGSYGAVVCRLRRWRKPTASAASSATKPARPFAAPSCERKRAAPNTSAAPVTLTTATDDRGRFVFVVTRSGEWRLTFEAPGFDAQTIPLGVRLGGAAPNLDVKLERRESPKRSARSPASTRNLCRRSWRRPRRCSTRAATIRRSTAYREIKATSAGAVAGQSADWQCVPGEEVVRRSRSGVSGSAERRPGRCRTGCLRWERCGKRRETRPKRRAGIRKPRPPTRLDPAADETGRAGERRGRSRDRRRGT